MMWRLEDRQPLTGPMVRSTIQAEPPFETGTVITCRAKFTKGRTAPFARIMARGAGRFRTVCARRKRGCSILVSRCAADVAGVPEHTAGAAITAGNDRATS